MRRCKLFIAILLLLVLISPLHIYAKWHLTTFSHGVIYTLLNVTYIPHDYKRNVWEGMITSTRPRHIPSFRHKYKGYYDVLVSSTNVDENDNEFVASIMCESGEKLLFNSKDIRATEFYRENNDELRLGSYLVEETSDSFNGCTINLQPHDYSGTLFLRFVKQTHW
ncbi:hypothetical protein CWI69_05990 [Pseudidiomarina halophila]|uniref:Uncharacterized protein n=1 Tax=Pseudidiomarina halophila TaxID=1449799 RepID=A0A432XV28_9GAMM|nr:hypothetical protein CWI69_05990 [Pseudidiomarina halophila]